jgi:hypothetical protein
MFNKGDLVKHCVFHNLRGVIIKESVETSEATGRRLLYYHVWWSDEVFTDTLAIDLYLIEDKQDA